MRVLLVAPDDLLATAPFNPREDVLRLRLDQACPCGSKKVLAVCCGSRGKLVSPPPVRPSKSRPRIGFRHPDCYANDDWLCARKLSGEHPMSATVLRMAMGRQENVIVTGHPWQKTPTQIVPIDSLKTKVLCTHHNSFFGNYDEEMGRKVDFICSSTRSLLALPDAPNAVRTVNGHDIEVWMLKVLCGTLRQHVTREGVGGPSWSPSREWLALLRGMTRWPEGWGLYLDKRPGVRWGSLMLRPIVMARTGEQMAVGLRVWLHGLVLNLLMVDPYELENGSKLLWNWCHRPAEVRWCLDDRYAALVFGWSQSRNPTARVNVLLTPGVAP